MALWSVRNSNVFPSKWFLKCSHDQTIASNSNSSVLYVLPEYLEILRQTILRPMNRSIILVPALRLDRYGWRHISPLSSYSGRNGTSLLCLRLGKVCFLKAFCWSAPHTNFCLLLIFSEAPNFSVKTCIFGRNLCRWLRTLIKERSCFNVWGGLSSTEDILFTDDSHFDNFRANPSLLSLRKTFSTILLWSLMDQFETIKMSSKKQITSSCFGGCCLLPFGIL